MSIIVRLIISAVIIFAGGFSIGMLWGVICRRKEMKLGDNRWHWKYICDKCGKETQYIGQKGFVGINHYYKSTQRTTPKRDFDLCAKCEKLLKNG